MASQLLVGPKGNGPVFFAPGSPPPTYGAVNAPPTIYRQVVLSDRPIAYWRFDETAGTVAADQMGLYPGSYTNSPGLNQPGALGNDRDTCFLNSATGWVQVPYSAGLNPGTFTYEIWAKPTTNAPPADSVLFASRAGNKGVFIYANTSTLVGSVYNGASQVGPSYSSAWYAGTWYHVALTYDGTTIRLYSNGVLRASTAGAYVPASSEVLNIGADSSSTEYFWPGYLDEAAVYSYALSTAQVLNHYNAGILGRNIPPPPKFLPYSAGPLAGPTFFAVPSASATASVAALISGTASATSGGTATITTIAPISGTAGATSNATLAPLVVSTLIVQTDVSVPTSNATAMVTAPVLLSGTASAVSSAAGRVATPITILGGFVAPLQQTGQTSPRQQTATVSPQQEDAGAS